MTTLKKSDISVILNLIQAEFPRAKEPDIEAFKLRKDMWYAALAEYSKEEVEKAVYEAITTSEFEPKLKVIVDICKRNRNPFVVSPLDLWNKVIDTLPKISEAVKDLEMGYGRAWNNYTLEFDGESYHSRGSRVLKEVFESLPPEIRRYFGNAPERLAALYKMTAEERSYEKARFLKTVQPFIDQQEVAAKQGKGDFFTALTSKELKAIPDKSEGGN